MHLLLITLLFLTASRAVNASTRVDSLLSIATDTTITLRDRRTMLSSSANQDKSGRAENALARLYLRPLDKGDAAKWIKRAIRRDPTNADFHTTRAELLMADRSIRGLLCGGSKSDRPR